MIRRPPRSTPFPTRRSSDLKTNGIVRCVFNKRKDNICMRMLKTSTDRSLSPGLLTEENENETNRMFLLDRKSTRLNSSHTVISYAVFCLKKKKKQKYNL